MVALSFLSAKNKIWALVLVLNASVTAQAITESPCDVRAGQILTSDRNSDPTGPTNKPAPQIHVYITYRWI